MMKKLAVLSFAFALGAGSAYAADCGEMPHQTPSIPNGESASANDIRVARDAVVAFSNEVDAYLTCMDERATVILPYLTKEQQARWDEDLADLHERRRELQTSMNAAIRAFRRSSQS